MANVFISYARRDKERVVALTNALEAEGLSVWWDSDLVPGRRYRQVIADQLAAADCVIVAWTAASLESDWVQDEAEEGRQRGVLIPVMLEPVRAPAGFRQVQSADLSQWTGSPQHPEFRSLLFAIRSLVQIARASGSSDAAPRPSAETAIPAGAETPTTADPGPAAARRAAPATAPAVTQRRTSDPPPSPPVQAGVKPAWVRAKDALVQLPFGWPWWVGVTVVMVACVAIIDAMEDDHTPWPYVLCTLPLVAGGAAMAARRAGMDRGPRAIAGCCLVGGGLVLGSAAALDLRGDKVAVFSALYFFLLAGSVAFALAIAVLTIARRRRAPMAVADAPETGPR